eukprot:jgi/Hompol1/1405/HPOL_001473-RA
MFRIAARTTGLAAAAPLRRSFAVLADAPSAVTYTRKGPQPPAAAPVAKAVSVTKAGVRVASADHLGPASTVAVVLSAGSRFDSPHAPGTAHLLKSLLVRSVGGYDYGYGYGYGRGSDGCWLLMTTIPGDTLTRTILESELRGNTIYSAVTREHVILASDFLRDDLVDAVPLLIKNVFNPSLQSYEFLDAAPLTEQQTAAAHADAKTKVIEQLHHVAFRTGLGNPLFASSEALHGLTRADVQKFAAKHLSADRVTIVGTGVAHTELVALVEKALEDANVSLAPAATDAKAPASRYFGGSARIEAGPHSETLVAYALPGAAAGSRDHAVARVLRSLLGGSPRSIKWGSRNGATGLLASAASAEASAEAFDAAYSDAGLIGFLVHAPSASSATAATRAAVQTIKSLASSPVSAEALARAKKAAIIDLEDSRSHATIEHVIADPSAVAAAALLPGSALAPEISAINSVSADQLLSFVKNILTAKPSIVAYGNSLELPYPEDL